MTWTQGSLSSCSNDWSLLCLETGAGPALTLPAPPQGAKMVFVTDTGGTGNLASWSQSGALAGLAGGDAICIAQATDANLPNAASFKAWLSTTAVDAADRITSDGPWMRRDGVLIAQSKADLLDGTIFTSINRTATDQPYGPAYVWTGTADDGTKAANTCNDWTNGTSGANGAYGDNSSTTQPREWSGDAASYNYCDRGDRLYCFED
jgi:hypothetical protein